MGLEHDPQRRRTMVISEYLSICLAAGAFGGVINALFVWGTGKFVINEKFGLNIKPPWTKDFIYNKVIWGAIWGLIFFFFDQVEVTIFHALIISIAPTLVQLFYVLPVVQKRKPMGKDLGSLTWLYVFVAN